MSANNNSSEQSPLSRDELIRQLALQNPGDFAAIINAAQTNLTNNNTNSNNNTNNNNNNTHNNTNSDAAALDNAHLLLSLSGTTTTPAIGLPTPGADTLASQSTASNNNTNNSHNNTSAAGLSSIATNATNAILPAVRDGTGETPAARLKARPRKNLPSSTARKLPHQKQMPITTPIRTTGGTAAKRRSRAAAAADDSDDSEEEDSPSKKARTSDDSDDEKKMPAKSDRELRLEKWDKQKSNDNDDDSSEVSEEEQPSKKRGKRGIKVTNYGTHSKSNDYPRTGLYAILFKGMLCIGKSVPINKSSRGLGRRIKDAHGKGVTKEVGEVTTISTGGVIHINWHDLELFFCFFLRSLLPKDKDGNYDMDKIVSTEMLDLTNKQEGVNILAEVKKMCELLNSGDDIFDDCYGTTSGDKICFSESKATSEVTHFKEHKDWKKWMLARYGRTEESAAKVRAKHSVVDPAEWDGAKNWFERLAYCEKFKEKTGSWPTAGGQWGDWLAEQREAWRNGDLEEDQEKALEAANVHKSQANHAVATSQKNFEKQLTSLAKFQAIPKHGGGSYPLLSFKGPKQFKQLGLYINNILIPKFYQDQLEEETVRKLYDDYGLKEFDPDKLDKIKEVNKLELHELRKKCKDNGIIYTKKTKHGYKLLELDTIRMKFARHITRPEEFTLTKVMSAKAISRSNAKKCCGGISEESCKNTGCGVWTSDKNPKKALLCCMDCGGKWDGDLPKEVKDIDTDWYDIIVKKCAVDKGRAGVILQRAIDRANSKKTTKKKTTKKLKSAPKKKATKKKEKITKKR